MPPVVSISAQRLSQSKRGQYWKVTPPARRTSSLGRAIVPQGVRLPARGAQRCRHSCSVALRNARAWQAPECQCGRTAIEACASAVRAQSTTSSTQHAAAARMVHRRRAAHRTTRTEDHTRCASVRQLAHAAVSGTVSERLRPGAAARGSLRVAAIVHLCGSLALQAGAEVWWQQRTLLWATL